MNTIDRNSIVVFILMVFVLSTVMLSATIFSGGSGTEYDPWQIATAADLDNVRDYPDSCFIQIDNIDLSSYEPWIPIANFGGSYNGNYYSIQNLYVSAPNGTLGLVSTNTGTLIRIQIEEISLTSAWSVAGAIVGHNLGIMKFCSSSGELHSDNVVGGLVGYNEGTILESYSYADVYGFAGSSGGLVGWNTGTIDNCYSHNNYVFGSYIIGGLVGKNDGGLINSSYSTGLVEGSVNVRSLYVGGLVGKNVSGTVSDSYWDTETSGLQTSDGGEGRTTSEMTYPYDQNTFMDWDFPFVWAADSFDGATGYPYLINNPGYYRNPPFFGAGTENNPYQIFTSLDLSNIRGWLYYHYIQMMNIDLDHHPYNHNQGWVPIGTENNPFLGSYNGDGYTIENLFINRPEADFQGLFGNTGHYNSGSPISTMLNNISLINANVNGRYYTGAIAGNIAHSSITNCYSTGIVQGQATVGGLVGGVRRSNVLSSYSSCSVTGDCCTGGLIGDVWAYMPDLSSTVSDCYFAGNVTGDSKTGGLIGQISWHSTITKCYSVGFVTATNEPYGGLIGTNYASIGTITHSYWDTESSGQLTSAGGEGKTTFEMLQESSLENWDFYETWEIPNFNTYIRKHYPILQWQKDSIPKKWITDNRIDNAHVKMFRGSTIYWESFPRLEEQDDYIYTCSVLQPLAGDYLNEVRGQGELMEWDDELEPPGWDVDEIGFNSKKGYKLGFTDRDDRFLYVGGARESLYSPIELEAEQENWIAYWIPATQNVFYAFGSIVDSLSYIKAEKWSVRRGDREPYGWVYRYRPGYLDGPVLEYGKMYVVGTISQGSVSFTWNLPAQFSIPKPDPEVPETRSQYFQFEEAYDYESFFIEEILDEYGNQIPVEEILEVGVFAGEECVGASVFLGGYPLEILAYTNESHQGKDISFEVIFEGGPVRGIPERITKVEALNNLTGEYSRQVLQPLRQSYTIVRLKAGDYTETVVRPQILMGQNYPNPFVMNSGSSSGGQTRSENSTNIPIFLSKDMDVNISVFNIKGQRVKTITSGNLTAGKHNISWDGKNEQNRSVGAGIYFYRLESDIETVSKKMLIIK